MELTCSGPGPHDPSSGVLGEADRPVQGMLCPACAERVVTDAPPVPPSDADRLAALEDAMNLVLLDLLDGGT